MPGYNSRYTLVLVVEKNDERLTWPERELIRQLGEKLYGDNHKRQEAKHE